MVLPDAILTGKPYPVKAMIVSGSNMALSWPNSPRIRRALENLDFLVVMDIFMTETAKMADLVLPAATFLESTDVLDHFTYVMLRKRVTSFAEAMPDGQFWLRLARRMGYESLFPWKNMEEALDYALEPSGLSVKLLKEEKPEGIRFGSVKYGEYMEKGFRTPSGKVELFSDEMKKLGYDPLPTYREPAESPVNTPELAREYPLVLTTGARNLGNLHSQLRNVPRLTRLSPEPAAEMHPATAHEYGIADGDTVSVESLRGAITLAANVNEDIMPGMVGIPHGWAEANVNALTSEAERDPVSGLPGLKAGLCRVRKAH